MLDEGNQIHNFILCICESFFYGSGIVNNYGSSSDFLKSYLRMDPVPYGKKLRFRFHNTAAATYIGSTASTYKRQATCSGQGTSVADPWHFSTDPDSTIFVSDLQDDNKNIFFLDFFALNTIDQFSYWMLNL